MLKFLEEHLMRFRSCFTRTATFRWFVVIIMGFMARLDQLGITSIIRALEILPQKYTSLRHFFRSSAVSAKKIRKRWHQTLAESGMLMQFHGRNFLIGDGTKQAKEGRRMPGVKKLHQESEDSSKPAYIQGHMLGCVSAVITRGDQSLSCPLSVTIQDGLKETAEWSENFRGRSDSHVEQMIQMGHESADYLASVLLNPRLAYLVLDRLFLTVPALIRLNTLNKKKHLLDLITRAKLSAVAYRDPPEACEKRRGRPRKKGEKVKLNSLFETEKDQFVSGTAKMYGKQEPVSYLCRDLLWGEKLYQKLRFVLVRSSRGSAILVSTDLNLDPIAIIEAYALRFKIELMFREMKQQAGALLYRFWSKFMPKRNRFAKSGEPSPLKQVACKHDRAHILAAVEATERFIQCSCIAMGLVQMIALTPSFQKRVKEARYLRTQSPDKVSEATVYEYLRRHIFALLAKSPSSPITQIIRKVQLWADDDSEVV